MVGNRVVIWVEPKEGYPLPKGDLDEVWLEGEACSAVFMLAASSCLHQNSFVKPPFDTMPGAIINRHGPCS